MVRLISFFSLLFCFQCVYSQTAKGIVKNIKGELLQYAHIIGNKGKEITITNEIGEFQFINCNSDTLFVSMVGYADTFIVINLKNIASLKIVMLEKKYILNGLIISPDNTKYKKQGKTLSSQKGKVHYTRYLNISSRIVQKFVNPYGHDGKIEQVKFNIRNAESDVVIRVMAYSIDQGLPSDNLLSENILLLVKKGSNKLVFDLSKKVILFPKQGCYIGIDVLKSDNKRVKIGFQGYRVEQPDLSLVSHGRAWFTDYIRNTYASFDVEVKVSFYLPKN